MKKLVSLIMAVLVMGNMTMTNTTNVLAEGDESQSSSDIGKETVTGSTKSSSEESKKAEEQPAADSQPAVEAEVQPAADTPSESAVKPADEGQPAAPAAEQASTEAAAPADTETSNIVSNSAAETSSENTAEVSSTEESAKSEAPTAENAAPAAETSADDLTAQTVSETSTETTVENTSEENEQSVPAVILTAALPLTTTANLPEEEKSTRIVMGVPSTPIGPIVSNGVYYTALQSAIDAVAAGASGEIQVLSDIDISTTGGTTPSGANVNGKKTIALVLGPGVVITADGYIANATAKTGSFLIGEGSTLNLKSKDATDPGSIVAKMNAGDNYGNTIITDSGSMTIDNVNIDTTASDLYAIQLSGRGSLVMNSGDITSKYAGVVVLNSWTPSSGTETPTKGMSVTINGGSITTTDNDSAIDQYGPGEITVNGGKLTGTYGAIYAAQGTVNINGGELNSTGTTEDSATIWLDDSHVSDATATRPYMPTTLNIKGGKFLSASEQNLVVDEEHDKLTVNPIKGGFYNTTDDIKPYVDVPEDYEIITNNDTNYSFKVVQKTLPVTPTPTASASSSKTSAVSSWSPSFRVTFLDCSGKIISTQWVGLNQAVTAPAGYEYDEPELNWVYRSITVSPKECSASAKSSRSDFVPPDTADKTK
jgi:hypothetical protein